MSKIKISGTGGGAEYSLSVSGRIKNGSQINNNDTVTSSSATGYVFRGADIYEFEGEITSFSIDKPQNAAVFVDGERVASNAVEGSSASSSTLTWALLAVVLYVALK